MTGISAVGVYDDFSSGQSTVTVRSADYETAGRVDIIFCILIDHLLRKDRIEDIFLDILVDLLLSYIRIMLSGKYHCIQTYRLVVLIVLNRNLALSIRTKVGQGSVFTNLGQLTGQLVSQHNCIGHILLGLVGCITEHHTLVAGADGIDLLVVHLVLFCFQRFVNAHSDIGGLLVDGSDHAAGVSVKTVFTSGVTNLTNGIANDFLNIYISLGGDLTHYQNHTGGGCGLAGYAAHGILC